jgi:valyl-tRNA synthetase
MGDVPFRKVYLHGMVCDENGDKMSKVKGNVIDPLDLVRGASLETIVEHAKDRGLSHEEGLKRFKRSYPAVSEMAAGFPAFGADAVRFYLAGNPPQSKRIHLQLRQVERARNFANKIWNATRFALSYLEPLRALNTPAGVGLDAKSLSLADRWIVSRLSVAVDEVNRGLDDFRLDEATAAARRFFWDELCDWYLELCKTVFGSADEAAKESARRTLGRCLETAFRLLHPFIPFVTEEVWQRLPPGVKAVGPGGVCPQHLAVAPFPAPGALPRDEPAERDMAVVQGVVIAVRNIRGELGIKPKDAVMVRLRTDDPKLRQVLADWADGIRFLTIARDVVGETAGSARPKGVGYANVQGVEVLVPLAELIDPEAEAARLGREIGKALRDVEKLEMKLANQQFLTRAPAETVARSRAERDEAQRRVDKLRAALATIEDARSVIG